MTEPQISAGSARLVVLDEWRERIGSDVATLYEACDLLRVSYGTMWRHVSTGRIPAHKLPDGSYRVPLAVLVQVTMPRR